MDVLPSAHPSHSNRPGRSRAQSIGPRQAHERLGIGENARATDAPRADDLPEDFHAGLTDDADDDGPSAAVVWAVVAAGLTLVGLGIWLL